MAEVAHAFYFPNSSNYQDFNFQSEPDRSPRDEVGLISSISPKVVAREQVGREAGKRNHQEEQSPSEPFLRGDLTCQEESQQRSRIKHIMSENDTEKWLKNRKLTKSK